MSHIKYKDEILSLSDELADVGYMAENIQVVDVDKNNLVVKRSHLDYAMTILISFPKSVFDEIYRLDEFLSMIQVPIHCYAIFNEYSDEIAKIQKDFKKINIVFDDFDEFKELYGTEIVTGSMAGDLCKSIFLISKDGAIFYIDILDDLEKSFDLERLQVELNKAYVTYTGVGCHG
ncbi:MAG: hypothetical protein PHI79_05425 [Sulfurovaceae bacterium]|nr:hypothetical protein [Sulfurovaceae bacterium]MDD5549017.1 hypothetical protein [Sulfurovaceae bacterium]